MSFIHSVKQDLSLVTQLLDEANQIREEADSKKLNLTSAEKEIIQRKINRAEALLKPYDDRNFRQDLAKTSEGESLLDSLLKVKKIVEGFQSIFRADPRLRVQLEDALSSSALSEGILKRNSPVERKARKIESLPLEPITKATMLKGEEKQGHSVLLRAEKHPVLPSQKSPKMRIDTPRDNLDELPLLSPKATGKKSPLSRLAKLEEDSSLLDDDNISDRSSVSAESPRSDMGSPLSRGLRRKSISPLTIPSPGLEEIDSLDSPNKPSSMVNGEVKVNDVEISVV